MNTDIIFTDKTNAPSSVEQKTTCPYCGVGCGVTATVENNTIVSVKGDVEHPSNLGRLCVKGSSLSETVSTEGRVLAPRVHGKEVSWDEATSKVAEHFSKTIKEHGPDSVAFYLSGQLLTEDYYVANKLMKGFIGSGNVDTNSRLCMASASTAHKRAFGEDVVPGCYEDFDHADVIFMVGSNAAYAHPIIYQRIVKAKENNPNLKVVVLDPRETATTKDADLHIQLKPGTDGYYYNGLLSFLENNDLINQTYVADHCLGFEDALKTAQAQVATVEAAAMACDVSPEDLLASYELFGRNSKVITVFSQGINQSSSGVDKGNAILNCHLATGKIGYEGAGPFSITGQPNAMGGREVGGLASQIAAHLHFEDPAEIDLVKRFWNAPNMAQKQGLKAVDMFNAIDSGKIKAVWIMATNPVVSMPDADFVKQALEKCPMVVVSECYENADTLACADVVLPATTWGEKQGSVTNSQRTISIQVPMLKAPGSAKNDWDIISTVARKMGFDEAFNYQHPHEIFIEHAQLSGFENISIEESVNRSPDDTRIHRAFDISGLVDLSFEEYHQFTPIQWPINVATPNGVKRLFSQGGFATKTGKANLIPILAKLPKIAPTEHQVILNTGRARDQWHTMTRTGRVPKLMTHLSEPYIEIHPTDAERFKLADKQLAQVNNRGASLFGRVTVSEKQRIGEVFVPIHWNDSFSASARVSALVNPITDDLCGQPEFKHSPVTLAPFNALWSGYLVSVDSKAMTTAYWTKSTIASGVKYQLADQTAIPDNQEFIQSMYPDINDWVVLKDDKSETLRVAGFLDNVLVCFFVASTDLSQQYSTQYIESQFGKIHKKGNRFKLLAALDSDRSFDVGAIVCSCFQVGEKTIKQAIESGECKSAEDLGRKLKCGTNCGSCIPELKSMF